jgi:hypothetical protein
MGLMRLAGITDRDVFGGDSLPVALRKLDAQRQPKRLSEADRFIAEAVAEQRVRNAEDRLQMLQKVQERLRNAEGVRRSRLEEAEIKLYPTIGDSHE